MNYEQATDEHQKTRDLELLEDMRILLAVPDHWCQHSNALTKGGCSVAADDKNAERFCLAGAATRISSGSEYYRLCRVANLLGFDLVGQMVAWNDTPGRTFEEVVTRLVEAEQRVIAR